MKLQDEMVNGNQYSFVGHQLYLQLTEKIGLGIALKYYIEI